MIWFNLLVVWWCASRGAVQAHEKPFYPEAKHAQHFAAFKATYNKQYATPEEERLRFNAFKKNLDTINKLNANDEHAVYDINEEADLTEDEIESKNKDVDLGSTYGSNVKMLSPENLSSIPPPPETFDWRSKGVVSKPRDQKNCNASYAFATIGNIESHYFMSRKKRMEFSVQQAIDCEETKKGCNGADPLYACDYYAQYGFMKEEDYKYVGTHSKCAYDSKKVVDHVLMCMMMLYPEQLVHDALVVGPLSALIDGRQFQWYSSGIITQCGFQGYNHAVLLTGYGHDKNGVKYWSLQNSRGENWGENGYVRIKRGTHCLGIAAQNFTLSWTAIKKKSIFI